MDLLVPDKKFAERLERQANDGHGWDKAPDMLRESAIRIRRLKAALIEAMDLCDTDESAWADWYNRTYAMLYPARPADSAFCCLPEEKK